MLRNSFKYVNYNDLKKFSSDFKEVYNAPNETAALTELENMKEKWGKKYPYAISNWENNWEDVSSFFQFSNDIRRIMYTTNIIEGLNRQYRKVTKTKSRNGEALLSPSFLLSVYSFGIYIIARNFRSYSRGRVWAEPTKGNNHDALLIMQKNRK